MCDEVDLSNSTSGSMVLLQGRYALIPYTHRPVVGGSVEFVLNVQYTVGHLAFETESYSADAPGQGLEEGSAEGKEIPAGGLVALDAPSVTSGSVGGGGSVTKGDGTGDSVGEKKSVQSRDSGSLGSMPVRPLPGGGVVSAVTAGGPGLGQGSMDDGSVVSNKYAKFEGGTAIAVSDLPR